MSHQESFRSATHHEFLNGGVFDRERQYCREMLRLRYPNFGHDRDRREAPIGDILESDKCDRGQSENLSVLAAVDNFHDQSQASFRSAAQ
jgi:hypothetical protein